MDGRLTVYVEQVTPRISYVFELVLRERLGLELTLTDDTQVFISTKDSKFSYGKRLGEGALHFASHGLLSEQGIRPINPEVRTHEHNDITIFPVDKTIGALDFDPFAAAFYLLTRYEEYLPHSTDSFGRYEATQSLAFRYGFLTSPIVDHWVLLVKDILQQHFPELAVVNPKYRFTSTIDVDNAYAYRYKGFLLNLGGMLRSILRGDNPAERIAVLTGQSPDPYDTYDYLKAVHEAHGTKPLFFFLLADRGTYDHNLPNTSSAMQTLIRDIMAWADVGIHPGFGSNVNPQKVGIEKQRLEDITAHKVSKSRQHFLMLKLPQTYRSLYQVGITDDYSMGYASHSGFRAGTSDSFLWYDLEREETTDLRIHPFACMDGTFRHYLKLTPKQAIQEVNQLLGAVKKVGGHFITVWHNETVNDRGIWKNWRKVFEHSLGTGTESRIHDV